MARRVSPPLDNGCRKLRFNGCGFRRWLASSTFEPCCRVRRQQPSRARHASRLSVKMRHSVSKYRRAATRSPSSSTTRASASPTGQEELFGSGESQGPSREQLEPGALVLGLRRGQRARVARRDRDLRANGAISAHDDRTRPSHVGRAGMSTRPRDPCLCDCWKVSACSAGRVPMLDRSEGSGEPFRLAHWEARAKRVKIVFNAPLSEEDILAIVDPDRHLR